jgi:hypothetical protein
VTFLNTLIGFSEESVEAHVRNKFFVVCFSGEEDDLTQWERYGRQNGYAIGFYARGLNRVPTSALYRVIYDEQKRKNAARELAEATIQFYLARSSTSNRRDLETRGFTRVLGVLATLRESLLPVH